MTANILEREMLESFNYFENLCRKNLQCRYVPECIQSINFDPFPGHQKMGASPEQLIARFGWADYLVFVGMLVISSFIGLYYGCVGSKQRTTAEFFRGDGKMGIFPVAMSLAAR